jgi:hypothetical protein
MQIDSQMQNNKQSHQDSATSLLSQAEAELAKGNEHLAERMWDHAARQFRSAAELYHRAEEHAQEAEALEKAAKLGIAAQVFLVWVIIGHVMPLFGLEWLDMARGVAAFNLPARVRQLFGVNL